MVNANLSTEVTVKVRWNALEKTILQDIGKDLEEVNGDCAYSLEEMKKLNNQIAQSFNPDNPDISVSERFKKEDHTGKNPVEELFDKTETILANMERQNVIVENSTMIGMISCN